MDKTLLERIDEAIVANRTEKAELNDILHKVKDQLNSKGKADYERGMNDIWEALNKFSNRPMMENFDIYGYRTYKDILEKYSPQDFLAKTEEYKKKEEEKTTNFKRGDKIRCQGNIYAFDAIYYGENKEYYWVLVKDEVAPQKLSKHSEWKLTKYGISVDIDSLLV